MKGQTVFQQFMCAMHTVAFLKLKAIKQNDDKKLHILGRKMGIAGKKVCCEQKKHK